MCCGNQYIKPMWTSKVEAHYNSSQNSHCDYLAKSIDRLIERVARECCE